MMDLGSAYDEFDGQVKCSVCQALLDIKTKEGSLKSIKLAKKPPSPKS
jgi:hypothetical protein